MNSKEDSWFLVGVDCPMITGWALAPYKRRLGCFICWLYIVSVCCYIKTHCLLSYGALFYGLELGCCLGSLPSVILLGSMI